jgi:hypothetical protein
MEAARELELKAHNLGLSGETGGEMVMQESLRSVLYDTVPR